MKVWLLWDAAQAVDECEWLCSVHATKEGAEAEMKRLEQVREYPEPQYIEEREVLP